VRDQGAPARAHVQQAPGGGSGGTCQDLTPCSRQLSQRCFRRKKLKSSGVQKDLVAHAHVRSFHTSRTALDVIPCFSASTELSVSLHSGGTLRVSTNAPVRRVRRQHWQLHCIFFVSCVWGLFITYRSARASKDHHCIFGLQTSSHSPGPLLLVVGSHTASCDAAWRGRSRPPSRRRASCYRRGRPPPAPLRALARRPERASPSFCAATLDACTGFRCVYYGIYYGIFG